MIARCHVAVIPYPGRGHVNPILNFSNLLASRGMHVTFIVTEEWLGLLGSEPKPDNLSFVSIPNVVPSELVRAADIPGFFRAVQTEMTEPVEQLLSNFEAPPDLLVADSLLTWAVEFGNKRKIPVASFCSIPASEFLAVYHHQLIVNSRYYPMDLSESTGEERIDFIPGIPWIRLADLPAVFQLKPNPEYMKLITSFISTATKAQCIIFRTIKELEGRAVDALRATISTPIYIVGPAIPYFTKPLINPINTPDYIKWLDTQDERSVLYVSQGSSLSASNDQINELVAGLKDSGIPFLWVGRNQTKELSVLLGNRGIVVQWCDQIRVLRHSSIGGFLTHCGWNSTLETAFVGVPALTFPLGYDQIINSKMIVEDWGIGWRLRNKLQDLVRKEKISELLKKFMDLKGRERKELDVNCNKIKDLSLLAVREDGSTSGLDEFLFDFFHV